MLLPLRTQRQRDTTSSGARRDGWCSAVRPGAEPEPTRRTWIMNVVLLLCRWNENVTNVNIYTPHTNPTSSGSYPIRTEEEPEWSKTARLNEHWSSRGLQHTQRRTTGDPAQDLDSDKIMLLVAAGVLVPGITEQECRMNVTFVALPFRTRHFFGGLH